MAFFYAKTGSLVVAGWAQTALALSVCHAFKAGFVPTINSIDTDYDANECDFDGYGAITLTTWQNPGYAAQGGSSIDSNYHQFEYVDGMTHVGNNLGGFWVEDATGHVIFAQVLDVPFPMFVNGNVAPMEFVLNFGS